MANATRKKPLRNQRRENNNLRDNDDLRRMDEANGILYGPRPVEGRYFRLRRKDGWE